MLPVTLAPNGKTGTSPNRLFNKIKKNNKEKIFKRLKVRVLKLKLCSGKKCGKKVCAIGKMTSPFLENRTLPSKNIRLPFFAIANFGTAKIGKLKSTNTRPTLTFGTRKLSETLKEM